MTSRKAGRHFLQIPGPSAVPDRILRAISRQTIDHRGPDFSDIGKAAIEGMKSIFKTKAGHVIIYPASGTGAWEAALINTLSEGDRVLMYETGHFAMLWMKMAKRLGLAPEFMKGIGAGVRTQTPLPPGFAKTRATTSRPSALSITRHRPDQSHRLHKCAPQSTTPVTPRF